MTNEVIKKMAHYLRDDDATYNIVKILNNINTPDKYDKELFYMSLVNCGYLNPLMSFLKIYYGNFWKNIEQRVFHPIRMHSINCAAINQLSDLSPNELELFEYATSDSIWVGRSWDWIRGMRGVEIYYKDKSFVFFTNTDKNSFIGLELPLNTTQIYTVDSISCSSQFCTLNLLNCEDICTIRHIQMDNDGVNLKGLNKLYKIDNFEIIQAPPTQLTDLPTNIDNLTICTNFGIRESPKLNYRIKKLTSPYIDVLSYFNLVEKMVVTDFVEQTVIDVIDELASTKLKPIQVELQKIPINQDNDGWKLKCNEIGYVVEVDAFCDNTFVLTLKQ